MDNYVGKYQGVEIYEISFDEFAALSTLKQNTAEKIYLIKEDNRVITKGQVFGNVSLDRTRLNATRAIAWQVAYANRLTQRQAKIEAEKKMETVITERPTVDSLVKETAETLKSIEKESTNKLEEVCYEALEATEEVLGDAAEVLKTIETESANKVLDDLVAIGNAKLTALAEEGKEVVNPTVKKRKPRVKTTTTAE